MSYSTLNVHRSMLSKTLPPIDGRPVGTHPQVKTLLAGCYNSKPPKPRYESTWDPYVVVHFASSSHANSILPMGSLSQKCVTLLALASLLRVSELASIDLPSVAFVDGRVRFSLLKPRKAQHSGPLPSFSLPELPDAGSCPVKTLKAYLDRTAPHRNDQNNKSVFITLRSPFSAVTASTVSRWIKCYLAAAGVDTSVYSAHSTRGAAASKGAKSGLSTDAILRAGSWSRETTFSRFYQREVEPVSVASVVLRNET